MNCVRITSEPIPHAELAHVHPSSVEQVAQSYRVEVEENDVEPLSEEAEIIIPAYLTMVLSNSYPSCRRSRQTNNNPMTESQGKSQRKGISPTKNRRQSHPTKWDKSCPEELKPPRSMICPLTQNVTKKLPPSKNYSHQG